MILPYPIRRLAFAVLVRCQAFRLLASIVARDIVEVGGTEPVLKQKSNAILALTPFRFRDDLEILAENTDYRIVHFSEEWKSCLREHFWGRGYILSLTEYFDPNRDIWFEETQSSLRHFLQGFLPPLYSRLQIKAVIGAATHYVHDYDIGAVSEEIGVPYVVFHRECFVASKGYADLLTRRLKLMGRFPGSHIVMHNEVIRDIYINSGFVDAGAISSLGCLRMDSYVARATSDTDGSRARKRVALFSFSRGAGLFAIMPQFPKDLSQGLTRFFDAVHCTVAKLAETHPEVDFVIKPKWGGNWVEEIERAFRENNIDHEAIENLQILLDTNAHDIILGSDVICGYNSTTLLEAGVAAKSVIIPFFEEACKSEYEDYVLLKDHFYLFDIATSVDDLASLILRRLSNPTVDKTTLQGRIDLFEKYVSDVGGCALEKYVSLLDDVIHGPDGAGGHRQDTRR